MINRIQHFHEMVTLKKNIRKWFVDIRCLSHTIYNLVKSTYLDMMNHTSTIS